MRWTFDSSWGGLFYSRPYVVELSFCLLICFLLYNLLKRNPLKKLPPGPLGLPFVGYLPFVDRKPQFTASKLGKKYGKIVSIRLGNHFVVGLNDYGTMKETLCHPSALDAALDAFHVIPESGFAGKTGEEWEEQRRFCMHAMRDLGLGRGPWEKDIQEEIPDFLNHISSLKGKPEDIEPYLHRTLCRNILLLLMGKKLEGKDDKLEQLACEFSDSLINYSYAVALSTFIPGLLKLLRFFNICGFNRAAKIVNDFSRKITKVSIKRHKEGKFTGENDFINSYLEKMQTKKANTEKHYFTEENAEGNLHALFFGATDTILASIVWLFRLMAGHPDIQKKVQDELDDIIGQDGIISFEDRAKIPYTFSVLMEAQRFACIAPMTLPRRAREEFEIKGYTIPKGAFIIANLTDIHHDPKYWEDPDEFKPERFQSEDGTKIRIDLPSFVPFSIGRRNCPGQNITWMTLLIYFASVMQKFSIKLPPGDVISYEYSTAIINHLKPQQLCFVERNYII